MGNSMHQEFFEVDELEGQIADLENQVSSLESENSHQAVIMAEQQDTISDLEATIKELEEKLEEQDDYEDIKSEKDEFEDKFNEVDLENFQNKRKIEAYETVLDDYGDATETHHILEKVYINADKYADEDVNTVIDIAPDLKRIIGLSSI